MSSLENKSSYKITLNNSRVVPTIGHVNHTAYFPKNNSLNQSGLYNGPYDNQYHRQSLRPDTRLGVNSNDNSKWLSSIEHVVSGEGFQNQMLDNSVPLYYSHLYSPEQDEDEYQVEEPNEYGAEEDQYGCEQYEQINHPENADARYFVEEDTPGESPEPYSRRQTKPPTHSSTERNLLNDTREIEKSYEKLSQQYRDIKKANQNSMPSDRLQFKRPNQKKATEHTKPGKNQYRRTSETSESPGESQRVMLHNREMSFQQIQMQRGVQVTSNPHRMQPRIELDERYASQSPSRNQKTSESKQFLMSNKTSHRSKSLDITQIDHRSGRQIRSEEMQMSQEGRRCS